MFGQYGEQMLLGLLLSAIAGMATGLGAAVAFFMKKLSYRVLTFALGASAGMMIYISFMEFIPSAMQSAGEGSQYLVIMSFFAGMVLIALIDRLIPSEENPHEIQELSAWEKAPSNEKGMQRSAYFFAAAIAIHNFPEGIATVVSALEGAEVAYSVALAVAIHNIPEGIAVAIPLYCATQSKWKSFGWATLSGLAEPLGALVAMLILMPFLSPLLIAGLFAAVAGIMVYISLDELLPMAQRWGYHHASIYGVMAGMCIIAFLL